MPIHIHLTDTMPPLVQLDIWERTQTLHSYIFTTSTEVEQTLHQLATQLKLLDFSPEERALWRQAPLTHTGRLSHER